MYFTSVYQGIIGLIDLDHLLFGPGAFRSFLKPVRMPFARKRAVRGADVGLRGVLRHIQSAVEFGQTKHLKSLTKNVYFLNFESKVFSSKT